MRGPVGFGPKGSKPNRPREPAQTQVRESVENQGKVSFEGKTHLPGIFYLGSLVLYIVLSSCPPGAVVYLGSCRTWPIVVHGQFSYLGSCLPGQLSPGQLSAWAVVAWAVVLAPSNPTVVLCCVEVGVLIILILIWTPEKYLVYYQLSGGC